MAFFAFCGQAETVLADVLPLPDRLVVSEQAVLPPHIRARDFSCLILDETPTEVIFSTSRYHGIEERFHLAKQVVEEIIYGTRGERQFAEIKQFLKLPADSLPAGFYRRVITEKLNPFLERFPDHPEASDVHLTIELYQLELDQLERGAVKIRGNWYGPEHYQYVEQDIMARQWLEETREAFHRRDLVTFLDLLDRMKEFRSSWIFPSCVENVSGWTRVLRRSLSVEAMREQLERERAWLDAQLVQLEISKNIILAREPESYFSTEGKGFEFFYIQEDRLWYRNSEAQVDEATGEVVRVVTPNDESRIQSLDERITRVQNRLAEVGEKSEQVEASFQSALRELADHVSGMEAIPIQPMLEIRQSVLKLEEEIVSRTLFFEKQELGEDWPTLLPERLSEVLEWQERQKAQVAQYLVTWPECVALQRIAAELEKILMFKPHLEARNWGKFEEYQTLPYLANLTEGMDAEKATARLADLRTEIERQHTRPFLPYDGPTEFAPQPFRRVQTIPISVRWYLNLAEEARLIQQEAHGLTSNALQALQAGEIDLFLQEASTVILMDPEGPGVRRIQNAAEAVFKDLLEAGQIQKAGSFHQSFLTIHPHPETLEKWAEEFSPKHLWGYRRFLNQPGTIGLLGIGVIGFVFCAAMILTLYLFIRRYVMRQIRAMNRKPVPFR